MISLMVGVIIGLSVIVISAIILFIVVARMDRVIIEIGNYKDNDSIDFIKGFLKVSNSIYLYNQYVIKSIDNKWMVYLFDDSRELYSILGNFKELNKAMDFIVNGVERKIK